MNADSRYQPPSAEVADVHEQEDVGQLNPFFSAWLRPRATIRQIVATDPNRLIIPLSMAIGVYQFLERASSRATGDHLSLGSILATAFVLGPFMGLLAIHVFAWLLQATGRILRGEAAFQHVRAALAWGNVPALWVSLSWIPALLVLSKDLFTSDTPTVDGNVPRLLVLVGFGIVQAVGGIWSIVTLCKMLGQVQGFSAMKALGNIVLAAIVVFVPIVLLMLAFQALR